VKGGECLPVLEQIGTDIRANYACPHAVTHRLLSPTNARSVCLHVHVTVDRMHPLFQRVQLSLRIIERQRHVGRRRRRRADPPRGGPASSDRLTGRGPPCAWGRGAEHNFVIARS
jgi:hypothetical protein